MIRWLNVRQPEPERYFKSDFLERFTFFRLSTVWMIWLPIILLSLFGSFYSAGKISTEAAGGHFFLLVLGVLFWLALGVLRWTLMEYFLHRFPFHYDGGSEFWRKISWYIHGIHHKQAMLSTRLVMPPPFSLSVGVLVALLDWSLMGLIFKLSWAGLALYAGTALGYLVYDTLHWSMHFIDTDWPWYRKLRSHHMRHHRFPQKRFGVSNTLWDHVFRTYPQTQQEESRQEESKQEEPPGA